MPRRKKRFTYNGKEYPEIYEETFKKEGRIHIRYYFHNDQGNKIRAQEKDKIVEKYSAFKISKNDESFPVVIESDLTPEKEAALNQLGMDVAPKNERREVLIEQNGRAIRVDAVQENPQKLYFKRVRNDVERNRFQFAENVGIPEIANLPRLKNRKRYTLRQIGNLYFERDKYSGKNALQTKELNLSKQYWKEFRIITGVKHIDEVTKTHLNNYNAELNKVKDDKRYRPHWLSSRQKQVIENKKLTVSWIKSRLDKVKTILKNARDIVEFSDDVEEVCKIACRTFYCEPIPRTIIKGIYEKEHLEAIFDVLSLNSSNKVRMANTKWKAVILLALNCACKLSHFLGDQF
jgi:hypothetical protein